MKCEKKLLLVQHINTATRKKAVEEATKPRGTENSEHETSGSRKNEFYADLTRTVFAVNIPWGALIYRGIV